MRKERSHTLKGRSKRKNQKVRRDVKVELEEIWVNAIFQEANGLGWKSFKNMGFYNIGGHRKLEGAQCDKK